MNQLTLNVDIQCNTEKTPRKSVRKKSVKKSTVNNDLMMLLFPEDFPDEYKEWLLESEFVNWSAADLELLHIKMVKDAFDILRRHNSSLSGIDECLVWCFSEDYDYDLTVQSCAKTLGVRTEILQNSLFNNLTATLRELKLKNGNPTRIKFISDCISRCRTKIEVINVPLTAPEFLAQYT
ncbi:hypothetical protein [Vibrio sp. 1180_3]|uniref:hypothetical protein n=1 Tax=Vibrio sp. 1180_3 TaxID=2528832 RepID=UPI002406EB62|nr:hypothetical protein [Vibrio sp. 1180_3]MDF9399147.1 hypothetical protein [Vibrio sp. 1180_3]